MYNDFKEPWTVYITWVANFSLNEYKNVLHNTFIKTLHYYMYITLITLMCKLVDYASQY